MVYGLMRWPGGSYRRFDERRARYFHRERAGATGEEGRAGLVFFVVIRIVRNNSSHAFIRTIIVHAAGKKAPGGSQHGQQDGKQDAHGAKIRPQSMLAKRLCKAGLYGEPIVIPAGPTHSVFVVSAVTASGATINERGTGNHRPYMHLFLQANVFHLP